MTLPDEMRQALAEGGSKPLYVEDPQTRMSYVLLPKSEYDRLCELLGINDASVADTYALQEAVARDAGWDDPIMDEYNNYDQRKKTA